MKCQDIPVLMYHDISDEGNDWCVTKEVFEGQITFLKERGYKAITLEKLHTIIKNNEEVDDKTIVITFDDARIGVFKNALPILKKHGLIATLFVVANWANQKEIPESEQYSTFMTWDEIKDCEKEGWEIGSHTVSHPNLNNLSQDKLQNEIVDSKKIIEEKIENKVDSFCYPYGKYNDKVIQESKKVYNSATTTNSSFSKELFEIGRLHITNMPITQFEKILRKPTISACLITKNEEENIRQCLDSIKDVVDEIIIVDTGSTDNTKKIAKEYTNNIFDLVWEDDFSKARNFSLSKASKDWIFVLDCDEIIEKKDQKRLLELVNNWNIAGYTFITKNYTNDSSVTSWQPNTNSDVEKGTGWYPSIKVRLFQNKNEHQFVGEIHEMVDESIKKSGGKIQRSNVFVHHYGTLEKNKSKKYVEITKKKIAQNPSAKAFYELGIQYKNNFDFDKAKEAFTKSIELGEESIYPRLNRAIVLQKQNQFDKAILDYEKVIEKNEKSADAYFGLAFCYYKKNDLEKAVIYFEKTIQYKPQFVDAYINLAGLYEKLNRFQDAVDEIRSALQISPKNARAYFNLGVIHEKTGNVEMALKCYKKALQLGYKNKEYAQKRINFLENR